MARTHVQIHHGGARVAVLVTSRLGLSLHRYGFEDPDVEVLYRLLRPGDRFVDAGAHVGLFTLIAASKVGPSGSVVAIEPAELTCKELRANVELNGYTWVETVQSALGSSQGVRTLTTFTGDQAALSSFSPAAQDGGSLEEVRVDTIDDLLGRRGDAKVAVLKIDVEGSELDVVRGALSTLDIDRPDVLMEVEGAHLARQGATIDELRVPFDALGYRAFRVDAGPRLVEDGTWCRPWRTPNVFLTVHPARAAERLRG